MLFTVTNVLVVGADGGEC